MIYDLHTHTTASDGTLTPCELVARAKQNAVDVLSITDHDTTHAYRELAQNGLQGPDIVPGIEISSNWARLGVHIVGLNIIPESDAITAAIAEQQTARWQRAEKIAHKLSKAGVDNALVHVRKLAGTDNIGRPHFARHLVEIGKVKDEKQAFRRYLGNGKIGDVRQFWPSMTTAIEWIRSAGGTAVLAHPAHYRLTNMRLRALTEDFAEAGGTAIEVVSGKQQPDMTRKLGELAVSLGLLASCGSDFHRPTTYGADVGCFAPLPPQCKPVWDSW